MTKPRKQPKPKVGDKMPDGTIFAGISPDTHKPMYAAPADAPLKMEFNDAVKYARTLDANGHKDWRMPTKDELNVMFNNRAAIGGFNQSGAHNAEWYWSGAAHDVENAWCQNLNTGSQMDGVQDLEGRTLPLCIRPVRGR